MVIGQGTAAVAGQAVADAITHLLPEDRLTVRAMPATELSGFHLRPDMSDTLVVAISQSGTTTDTNRTVDLARGRGATVVAVVNRRGSDLVSKSDGVLFTSDGRDIEMSVASTKAFYSQVAAGFLLAVALRQAITDDALDAEAARLLEALRELPTAMEAVLADRAAIAETAARLAPKRRYWAVVGNGSNRVAAAEIRIKLSELCYKSIACDATEDKKHIDLSAEPLILVCAAALSGSTLADVAKEVAIYRAHKAMPIVIATRGAVGFEGVPAVLEVPPCHPRLAFVLATMVGHLFGYEAAIAIDRLALPMREIRGEIERLAARARRPGENLIETLRPRVEASIGRFLDGLGEGRYDGQLEASTAVRLTSLLRYVGGTTPLESYGVEHGRVGTPSAVIEDLTLARDPGDRGADAAGRRHQAPGEDGDGGDLAHRRGAAGGAAGEGGARERRAARSPVVPRPARAGRARRGGRGGARVHALSHRRGQAGRPGHDRGRGARRRRARDPVADAATTPSCAAPSTRWCASASSSSRAAAATAGP